MEHIPMQWREILHLIESESTKEFQLVLYSIIKLTKQGNDKLFTKDIYDYYNAQRDTKAKPLAMKDVEDILAELDMLNLIKYICEKGTREVNLNIPINLLNEVELTIIKSSNEGNLSLSCTVLPE